MVKDCNVPLNCKECGSETHTTALHPEPLPLKWKSSGGEQKEQTATNVTSNEMKFVEIQVLPDHVQKYVW